MEQSFFLERQPPSLRSVAGLQNNGRRLLSERSSVGIGDTMRRLKESDPPATAGNLSGNSNPPGMYQTPPQPFQGVDPNVVIIMVVLLFALVCAAFVNSLMRCAMRRRAQAANARPVFIISQEGDDSSEQGLDAKTLASLPVLTFKPAENSKLAELDCTICLSEFTEDERLRLLPKCSHVFHLDCIDMWLLSNTSCPICRDGIKADEMSLKALDEEPDSGEVMILTVDQDGNPSVRTNIAGRDGAGGAMEGGAHVPTGNVRGELQRDRSWNSLSESRLVAGNRRSMSMGRLVSQRRDHGTMSGRIISSPRSSFRAAISASGGYSGRGQAASSSSVPAAAQLQGPSPSLGPKAPPVL